MIRLIVYIALSLLVTAGAAWLISLPGTVTIDVANYRLQPGLGAVALGGGFYCCRAGIAVVGADAKDRQGTVKQERNVGPDRMAVKQDRHAVNGLHPCDLFRQCGVIGRVKGFTAGLDFIF